MEVIIVLIIIGIVLSSFSSNKSNAKKSNPSSSNSINTNKQKWYSCGKCGHQELAYSKPTTCMSCNEWGIYY